MWLFGDDIADLRAAELDIQAVLRSIKLHMNLGKTEVLEGDDLMAKARQLEHSAIEVALTPPDISFESLDALLDKLIARPETASHTSLRFVAVRMRRLKRYERVDELVAVAPRMPHASKDLGRLFRDSGAHNHLADWYVEYLNSKWARVELAPANIARMFPSSTPGPSSVIETFMERAVAGRCSLPLLSIICQRMAAWIPREARGLFRQLGDHATDPHVRRVIAFSALTAKESRLWVKRFLGEFKENAPTLAYLEDRNFSPVPAQADFAGY
jgi:hypothetical protein